MNNFEFIKDAVSNGVIFSAVFVKKNGEKRTMVARTGVKKGLVNDAERKRPAMKVPEHLMTVWDMQKGCYKYINLNTLESIKVNGVKYNF